MEEGSKRERTNERGWASCAICARRNSVGRTADRGPCASCALARLGQGGAVLQPWWRMHPAPPPPPQPRGGRWSAVGGARRSQGGRAPQQDTDSNGRHAPRAPARRSGAQAATAVGLPLSCGPSEPMVGLNWGLGHCTRRAGRGGACVRPRRSLPQLLFCLRPLPGAAAVSRTHAWVLCRVRPATLLRQSSADPLRCQYRHTGARATAVCLSRRRVFAARGRLGTSRDACMLSR